MKFTHYVENNVSIVALEGNLLGEADSQPTLEFIQNQIGEGHKHFVLNLTLLKYVNSTGLSVLLTTLSKSRNAGGDLVLVNIPEQLRQLLQITKLIDVFTECSSDKEGIDKLS
ncbi:MAG: STAS domain-containing protein [Chitinophagales bacterium]